MTETDAILHKTRLLDYFDGIGFERWSAIYGNGPLSRIRHTIREGHDRMLNQAETWLLESVQGGTLLDAGCGTGLFSLKMAQRGFDVTAADIAPRMVDATREAAAEATFAGSLRCIESDIESLTGQYDAVVCFDVLVHYPKEPFKQICAHLAERTDGPLLFTYAPYSHLLASLHWIGGHFPYGHRRTEIQMIPNRVVDDTLAELGMKVKRTVEVSHGFYHVRLLEAERL